MDKKAGFRTITYRFHLYCDRMDWLELTKEMFNKVLGFYYEVLLKEQELWTVPKLKRMRAMELLTVGARHEEQEDVKYPIPFEKVPLYFRRAAINEAIRLHEIYRSVEESGMKPADGSFDASPIYYKGMYKEFCSTSIRLKVFNGDKWVWVDCSIDACGRTMPEEEQIQSPIIVLKDGCAMLHVPVREDVEDVRPLKERLQSSERICAVYFPGSNTMAAMVVMTLDGTFVESKFIHGGDELKHRKKLILKRIEENRASMGGDIDKLPEDENKRLWEKIHRLTDDKAHKVSREIVDFCKERGIDIIVIPNYGVFSTYKHKGYMTVPNYDWIGRRIISYVKYKAFGESIIVASTSTKDIASTCYICKQQVKKYNKDFRPGRTFYGGKNFICMNGHKGSSYFNSAMNVGKNFLENYGLM